MRKNILIVTGGSGGHVVPSFSLINHLKNKFYVKIVTDLRGTNFIDKDKHEYDLIDVPNLFIKLYLLPINIFKYFFSIIKSYKYLKKFINGKSKTPENLCTFLIFLAVISIRFVKLSVSNSPRI